MCDPYIVWFDRKAQFACLRFCWFLLKIIFRWWRRRGRRSGRSHWFDPSFTPFELFDSCWVIFWCQGRWDEFWMGILHGTFSLSRVSVRLSSVRFESYDFWYDFQFTMNDAEMLATCLAKCYSLETLAITRSRLEDDQARVMIKRLLSHPRLRSINLSHNR